MHKYVYRYDISGEMIGIQNVNDWQDDEIMQLVQAIQKRGDGSWASMNKIRTEVNVKTKRTQIKTKRT